MTAKGIQVSPQSIPYIKRALRWNGFPTQRALASDVGLSLSTVSSFFNGKRILFLNFVEICERLNLDWKQIADHDLPPPKPRDRKSSVFIDIDAISHSSPHNPNHNFYPYNDLELHSLRQFWNFSQLTNSPDEQNRLDILTSTPPRQK